ncbi:MAG: hypothetical protein JSS11_08225 [Verrucomicrobia bacterium]|nr:hypothetical protein [Verrucomicrobiota bacterium]
MLKKYTIEYSLNFRKHHPPQRHQYFTDEAVACEDFVRELLERGMALHAIKRDGADLPAAEFDRIVKVAAGELAAGLVCRTLHIKPDEERHRFGFTA